MASPAHSTISAPAGSTIHGGWWAGGRLSGDAALDAAVAAGVMAPNVADVSGAVVLDAAAPAGVLAPQPIADRDTFIYLEGQSNDIGVGAVSEFTSPPLSSDTALTGYWSSPFARVYILSGSTFVPLDKFNSQTAGYGLIGPEFGIAVRWMRETATGRLYIIKQCVDGGFISQFQPGTAFWTTSLANRSAANAWFASNGVSPVDGGWMWVQGESNHSDTQASYQTALTSYIDARLSNGLQTSTSPRVLAQICAPSTGYGAGVEAAKAAYAAANPTVTRIVNYLSSLNADSLHLNARGQIQLAYDGFQQLFGAGHIST